MTTPIPLVETPEDAIQRLARKARREGVKLYRDVTDGRYYASSVSSPDHLHYVTGVSCDCAGFASHQRCKHHAALMSALGWLDETLSPEPAPPAQCPECQGTGTTPGTVRSGRRSWRYDSVTCGRCHGAGAVAVAA